MIMSIFSMWKMKINSNVEYLFYKYLKLTNIDVVVDIGSMDGKNSLYFRNILPHASLYAFEANPWEDY